MRRRSTLAMVGLATSALLITACGGSDSGDAESSAPAAAASSAAAESAAPAESAASEEAAAPDISGQTLTVSNWAGYYPEDLAAQVEAANGTPVTIANHATNEEIMAKLTAGGDSGFDVAFVSGQYAQALNDAGLLEAIDAAQVPNLSNLFPEATQLAYDPGNTFSVPYAWGTTGICYRSDLIDEPTSWNAILEPSDDSKGKVTQMTTERWLALPALKALGYSINTTDDAELEKAKELLIASKPDLLAYDDTTFYSRLVSGEANAVVAWDGWCNYGTAENPDIKFVVPEEGSDLWADTMVILKSSQNKEAAHAFINFILDPANHAWVAENILYKVPNQAAMAAVGAELAKAYPNMGYTPSDLLQQETIVDLGEDSVKYTDLATEVTSS
jgi:spermidine/putrescine transport system substrate-binding protein